jgi:hypothetical protein
MKKYLKEERTEQDRILFGCTDEEMVQRNQKLAREIARLVKKANAKRPPEPRNNAAH